MHRDFPDFDAKAQDGAQRAARGAQQAEAVEAVQEPTAGRRQQEHVDQRCPQVGIIAGAGLTAPGCAACQRRARHVAAHDRAGIQQDRHIGAVDDAAGEHFGQRHVAHDIADDGDDQQAGNRPRERPHKYPCTRRQSSLRRALRHWRRQADRVPGQNQRQTIQHEQQRAIQAAVGARQHTEPVDRIQQYRRERPYGRGSPSPLRQQAQHRDERRHQGDLVHKHGGIGLQHQNPDHRQQDPG